MSRFYASIQGTRGEATRQGHSIIEGHVRGWNLGVEVRGMADARDEERDAFDVYATSGSRGGPRKLLGTLTLNDAGEFEFTNEDARLREAADALGIDL